MYESEESYERELHLDILKKINIGVVELGILNGDTSSFFLENCNLPVYGIDPIIPDSMDANLIGNINYINMVKRKFPNFKFVQNYSYNVAPVFNYKFDYLFIDADHQYEAVKRDFLDWFPLLSSGGYIGFHDSAKFRGGPYYWDGPSIFVDELIQDINNNGLEYYRTVNSLTVFKKL